MFMLIANSGLHFMDAMVPCHTTIDAEATGHSKMRDPSLATAELKQQVLAPSITGSDATTFESINKIRLKSPS